MVDMITNIKNVIANAAHREEDHILGQAIDETRRRHGRSFMVIVRIRVAQQLLNILMWLMLYGFAIHSWILHQIAAGDFVLITTLGGQLINRAQDVGDILPKFIDDIGSASESIQTLIVPRQLTDAPGARALHVARGAITFDHVRFAYEGSAPVFRDLHLTIAPGQRVGLIGTSGAGKSTLATLLLRLHDVAGGAIRIDGQDIRQLTQELLRRQIGLIPQDTILFYRSLLDNIRYGRPAASDADVIIAARHAHAMISSPRCRRAIARWSASAASSCRAASVSASPSPAPC